jgi:hypothetical protein
MYFHKWIKEGSLDEVVGRRVDNTIFSSISHGIVTLMGLLNK